MNPEQRTSTPTTLPLPDASRLIRLVLEGEDTPQGGLLDLLNTSDGASWFLQGVASLPMPAGVTPESGLLHSSLPLTELHQLKERCKTLYATRRGKEQAVALLGYYLCLASALGKGTRMGSQGSAELRDTLLAIASAAPAPWGEWLERASASLE